VRLRNILPTRARMLVNVLEEDVRNMRRVWSEDRLPVSRSKTKVAPEKATQTRAVYESVRLGEHALVIYAESEIEVTLRSNESILTAGLRAGVPMAYSCTLGGCGSCMVRVLEGQVEYEDRESACLTDEEIEEGYCLPCIGRARGRVVIEA